MQLHFLGRKEIPHCLIYYIYSSQLVFNQSSITEDSSASKNQHVCMCIYIHAALKCASLKLAWQLMLVSRTILKVASLQNSAESILIELLTLYLSKKDIISTFSFSYISTLLGFNYLDAKSKVPKTSLLQVSLTRSCIQQRTQKR